MFIWSTCLFSTMEYEQIKCPKLGCEIDPKLKRHSSGQFSDFYHVLKVCEGLCIQNFVWKSQVGVLNFEITHQGAREYTF